MERTSDVGTTLAPAEPGGGGGPPSDPGGEGGGGRPSQPAGKRWRTERLGPRLLHAVTFLPLVLLGFVVGILVWKAIPAVRYNGLAFFHRSVWNFGNLYAPLETTRGVSHPPGAEYGAVPLIFGTVVSSAIALVLAVPVAIGTALAVVEKLPPRLSHVIGVFLEVLAGIPSVLIGLWGFFTLGPFLSHHVAPLWADHMPDVPVLRFFRGPTGNGQGILTAGVVLALMVLPIIAATTRDLIRQVPRSSVEGAIALGMTDSEAARAVTLPWVRSGIIGASMLGLGRALGETIAVAMVCGDVVGSVPHSLYSSFTTIAATIVSQLDGAQTDASGLAVSTLAEVGLVLMVITLVANVGARLMVRRVSTTALPVGRGI